MTTDEISTVRFVAAGRYGHIATSSESGTAVAAISIRRALRDVARLSGHIDLVKIDTEGTDPELAASIPRDLPIGEVRYEDNRGHVVTAYPYAV